MFFRGAPFQRDGHGGCNLVPASPLFSKTTGLVPSELTTAPQRPCFRSFLSTVPLRRNCSGSGHVPLIAPTLLMRQWAGPLLLIPYVEHAFHKTLRQVHQPSRRGRRQGGGTPSPSRLARAHHKGLVHIARASDLCQASTGESYSVF